MSTTRHQLDLNAQRPEEDDEQLDVDVEEPVLEEGDELDVDEPPWEPGHGITFSISFLLRIYTISFDSFGKATS
jgi:hypothetical protein